MFSKLSNDIKHLCKPAYVYLVISVIATVVLMFQNSGNQDTYCVGSFECPVPNTAVVFIVKILYIAFWTFVLNAICRTGHKQFAWFLVLLPFILFFVLIGMIMLRQGVY
uniref:Uncharacterized protein n=1 Tax=viral metagenome TaxID=1070528 RepID=A0A6C0IIC0_9ZZZZ